MLHEPPWVCLTLLVGDAHLFGTSGIIPNQKSETLKNQIPKQLDLWRQNGETSCIYELPSLPVLLIPYEFEGLMVMKFITNWIIRVRGRKKKQTHTRHLILELVSELVDLAILDVLPNRIISRRGAWNIAWNHHLGASIDLMRATIDLCPSPHRQLVENIPEPKSRRWAFSKLALVSKFCHKCHKDVWWRLWCDCHELSDMFEG